MKYLNPLLFVSLTFLFGSGLSFADSDKPIHKFIMEDKKGFLKYDEPEKTFADAKVLIDDEIMVVEMHTPAWNLHGVDSAPNERTELEQKKVEKETQRYRDNPHKYFRFVPDQACSLISQIYKLEKVSTTEKAQKRDAGSWRSFDIRAEMVFDCTKASPKKMQIDLFSAFPRIKKIRAQTIVNDGEVTKTILTPEKAVIPIASSPASE